MNSPLKFVLFVLYLCLVSASVSAKNLPPIINYCPQNSPDINKCFKKAIEQLRPFLADGVPELLIPPLDPMVLPEASLDDGRNFKAHFKNIKIYHAVEFILEDAIIDLKHDHAEIKLLFPKLRMTSDYNVDGSLLIFTVKGEGPVDGNLTNARGHIIADAVRYKKNGQDYWNINKKSLTMDLGKPVLKFERLFGDNRELNDQTNKLVNENIEELIEELRPVLVDTVSQVVFGITDRIFEKFSVDDLFPPK